MLATLTRTTLHVLTLDVAHERKEELGDLALQNHGSGGTSEMREFQSMGEVLLWLRGCCV